MKTAVFTIASRNYFAFVRTLMDSLENSNPEWDRFVCVCDEISDDFKDLDHHFFLVDLDDLNLPYKNKMAFRYTIMEFNTAIKPFVFRHIFNSLDYDRVIYLDPDIYVYAPMKEVEDLLDGGYNFVFTPHLTKVPPSDGKIPDETTIMTSGIYNLGFLALNKCEDTDSMLSWWERKLEKQCVVEIEKGVFVDQKWMDLVPGMYPNVAILRNEGYNTAYWNLSHRKARKQDGRFYFNNDPLVFFHFSGFNPRDYSNVSKHQNRFTISGVGDAKELFDEYAEHVLENDFNAWGKYEYKYNKFSDGHRINDLIRYAYRKSDLLQSSCGDDPFSRREVFYDSQRVETLKRIKEWSQENRKDIYSLLQDVYVGNRELFYHLQADYHLDIPMDIRSDEKALSGTTAPGRIKQTVKLFIKRHTTDQQWESLKKAYRTIRKPKELTGQFRTKQSLKFGVNLIGYIRSEHGVGEACRHTAECLNTIPDLEWSAYDFELSNLSRQEDHRWDAKIVPDVSDFSISIFNINADQMQLAKKELPAIAFEGYKIGVWYWELENFPKEWMGAFDLVDELWAPTRFIESTLKKVAPCPVFYMPPCIQMENPNPVFNRQYFGIPEDAFLYLTMYDTYSICDRKNPRATLLAFQEAFDPDDESVGLVLKVNNATIQDDEIVALQELIGNYKNIYIIAKTLSREEINALVYRCDVAVSLHRSEGLGLFCQEAMALGRPVIATAWSGNADFTRKGNSCPVDYTLVPVGANVGPYKSDQLWADPNITQASMYMKQLKESPEFYHKIAEEGKKTMENEYSPEVCGRKMGNRLRQIQDMMKESNAMD